MEVIKDKETGSTEIYLSKEEVLKVIKALDKTSEPILSELNYKLWNS